MGLPDDLYVDPAGNVHILYMWVNKRDRNFSRVGAYVVYHPASRRFTNAAGEDLGLSPNFASAAAYQPWPAGYDPANQNNGTGVEVAKFSLDAERLSDGTYVERSLASTHPKIERLSVIGRPDGTDIVYLSAPFTSTLAGELYLGTVPRGAQT